MQIAVLGPLRVVIDEVVVDVDGARLQALLTRLALSAGRVVSTATLVDALWPQESVGKRRHALQSLMSRLRRALGGHPALRTVPDGYRLDVPDDAVDALQFERSVKQARGRLAMDGATPQAVDELRQALSLWRGEPFLGLTNVPFATAAAERLCELRLVAVEERIAAELALSVDPRDIVAELSVLVTEFPLREPLRCLLLRSLDAQGRRAEALSAYEEYRGLLAEELGVDPGPELRAIHLDVLRGARVVPPSGPARRGASLPVPSSSFVGREAEVAGIAARMLRHRLVTIVGPGGVGKTRLAIAVAALPDEGWAAGVWFVDLAPVSDPDDVVPAVAAALTLRIGGELDGSSRRDPLGRLVDALSTAEGVVVLDNCEHLLDAAAACTEALLRHCPGLRVLATSREPLGLAGETVIPVDPLGLPREGARHDEALASPAVRLLCERVTAVRPQFRVSEENVAAVVDVCRALDGLPLAIELAACRLRTMPLGELVGRLTNRFGLLSTGHRTAQARHRTLSAVVDWSWQLLGEPERELAARLAIFPGDISVAAAADFCARVGMAPDEVVEGLSLLADKSWLHLIDGAQPRYRMLETIREFALERLAVSGDRTSAKRDFAASYADLAEAAADGLRGSRQLGWIARLSAERANPATALRYAAEVEDATTAVRLAAALGWFWTVRGEHAAAADLALLALRTPGPRPVAAEAMAAAMHLFNRVMSGGTANGGLGRDEALLLARRARRFPAAAVIEASLALLDNDIARGVDAVNGSLPDSGDWDGGLLLLLKAFLLGNDGDLPAAQEALVAAVGRFRNAGERWGLAWALRALAHTEVVLGEFDRAIEELAEAVRLVRELDPEDPAVGLRTALAVARSQKGDIDTALRELADVLDSASHTAASQQMLFARIALGNLCRHAGDVYEATVHYATARKQLEAHASQSLPLQRAMLGAAMGHQAIARDDFPTAARHLVEAFTLASAVPDMPVAALSAVAAARLRLRSGSPRTAASMLGAADVLRGAADVSDPDVAAIADDLSAALGRVEFEAAYARGRAHDRAAAHHLIEMQLGLLVRALNTAPVL
ncbi:BTAD domain-containing putative transcriptional regulator [Yinghuangia aomiensis]|uniref:BTAD domain-containing putative transcriptional regulator n=1 Tax=Yinghuangia aomiensis TaxID=676205 RepID=A0ABP9HU43_9ACTN